jgi:hypothetical protein
MLNTKDKVTILNYALRGVILSGVTFVEQTLVADTNTLLLRLGFYTGEIIFAMIDNDDAMWLLDEFEWLEAGGLQVLAKLKGIKDVRLPEE